MEQEKKFIDLTDCEDGRVDEIRRGVDMWRKSGQRMHMILDSRYDSDVARARAEGVFIGTLVGVVAAGVGYAIHKARPKIKKVGAKIKEKFAKK